MNAVTKDSAQQDFKVRDMSLAELGRRRTRLAEEEIPGLMQIRARYAFEPHTHEGFDEADQAPGALGGEATDGWGCAAAAAG